MFEHFMIRLLFILLSFSSKSFAVQNDIFESGANARFYASKESTEGCPIPPGRYTIRNILGV